MMVSIYVFIGYTIGVMIGIWIAGKNFKKRGE